MAYVNNLTSADLQVAGDFIDQTYVAVCAANDVYSQDTF